MIRCPALHRIGETAPGKEQMEHIGSQPSAERLGVEVTVQVIPAEGLILPLALASDDYLFPSSSRPTTSIWWPGFHQLPTRPTRMGRRRRAGQARPVAADGLEGRPQILGQMGEDQYHDTLPASPNSRSPWLGSTNSNQKSEVLSVRWYWV